MSQDITTNPPMNLRELTYEELSQLEESEEILGSELIEDKSELIKVPFSITHLTFRESDTADREYVSVEATTKDNRKVVFNDGGTGIRDQLVIWAANKGIFDTELAQIENRDKPLRDHVNALNGVDVRYDEMGHVHIDVYLTRPLHCPRGLRKSEYQARERDGVKIPAGVTYYLA